MNPNWHRNKIKYLEEDLEIARRNEKQSKEMLNE